MAEPNVMPVERNMVFVSHATPEDNEFAQWITLQLAKEGYPVWCDLTKLLGGETFWNDIQDAIQHRTSKFLYVLSRSSNVKEGALQELDCAKSTAKRHKSLLSDFIIPLKIDDLPHDEVYIGLQRINSIPFGESWANGLAQLFEKLAESQVPKDPRFNPDAVCSWWRSQREYSAEQGILEIPEDHLSNWYRIDALEEKKLLRHFVSRRSTGAIKFKTDDFPEPGVKDSDLSFLSFYPAAAFEDRIGQELYIADTQEYPVAQILAGEAPKGFTKHLTELLRGAWERFMSNQNLPAYEMSSNALCFYFPKGRVPNDTIYFDGVGGKRCDRQVVGHSTRNERLRYWHYGVRGKPVLRPEPLLVVKGIVLFTNDGQTVWKSKDKLAKARRSQCKSWWNDEWRDRMLAVMSHLAGEDDFIRLPLSATESVAIGKWPMTFESPVSYLTPDEVERMEIDDYAFEEDLDEDDLDDDGEEQHESTTP